MTRLSWESVGKRFYEAGVDRGVLYVDGVPPVPWVGLVSVSEKAVGGEHKAYYIDGVKYLNTADSTEYEASIEAITYPEEFAFCEGTINTGHGLYATNQPQRPFSLCYRTSVGNDTDGVTHAYKIHMVYNALAKPNDRAYSTIGSETTPINFSWDISATPVPMTGYKPTAHYVVDTRDITAAALARLEDVLYGTVTDAPRLPLPNEVRTLVLPTI